MIFPEEENNFDKKHGMKFLVLGFAIIIFWFLLAYFVNADVHYKLTNVSSSLDSNHDLINLGSTTFINSLWDKQALFPLSSAKILYRAKETDYDINSTTSATILTAFKIYSFTPTGTINFIYYYEGGNCGYQIGISASDHPTNPNSIIVSFRETTQAIQYFWSDAQFVRNRDYRIIVKANRTNNKIIWYLNNIKQASEGTLTGNAINPNFAFSIGQSCTAPYPCTAPASPYFNGTIEDFYMLHRLTTRTEDLYYNNSGMLTESYTPPTPTLTLNTQLQNNLTLNYSENPFTFYYNGTTQYTRTNNYNCTLRLNNTIWESKFPTNINQNQFFTINYTNWEKGYNINVTCKNTNTTASFKKLNEYFDYITPAITSSCANNTAYVNRDGSFDNVNCIYTLFDTNLFGFNFTVKKSENNSILKSVKTIGLTPSTYTYTYTIPVDNIFTATTLNLSMLVCDSHTGKKLKFEPKIVNNEILYNGIRFYCDDIKKMDFVKEIDKIKPKIEFNKKSIEQLCYYESTNELILVNDEYKNHYVSWENKIWIDEPIASVEKINNNKIKLHINGNVDKFTSESFGDLNCNRKVWFNTITYISSAQEQSQAIQNLSNNINLLGNKLDNRINDFNNLIFFIIAIILFILTEIGIFRENTFLIRVCCLILFIISLFIMRIEILKYGSLLFCIISSIKIFNLDDSEEL